MKITSAVRFLVDGGSPGSTLKEFTFSYLLLLELFEYLNCN